MTPWTRRLLVANVVAFALTRWVAPRLVPELALVPALVLQRPWTLVTYMFLHGGLWHLLANMIGLFFFGPRLEARLGSGHFLGLYAAAGLAAAGASWVFTPGTAVIGASGAVFGVLLGFARYWPRERIFIWGVLPLEARWLVAILAALALSGGFGAGRGNIAHFAHLGGFAGGWIYLWARDRLAGRAGPVRRTLRRQVRSATTSRSQVRRWRELDPEDLHQVNRRHLEKLQRKLEEEGAGALGRKDREFLERMVRQEEGEG